MTTKQAIDWDEAFRWLEMGYLTGDIALLFGLNVTTISRRARTDLTEEQFLRWKALNRFNRRPDCGTYNGYQSHLQHGEVACGPCKKAWADKTRGYAKRCRK